MRNVSVEYKAYGLIYPTLLTANGTTIGTAVQVIGNEEQDAMAIVSIGAIAGAPTSTTVTVTIAGSATSGGTYTTLASFPVAGRGITSNTAAQNQVGTQRVPFNPSTYSWIRASAAVYFTAGTTPSVSVGVTLLQKQTVMTESNVGLLV